MSDARQNDVELLRAASDAGLIGTPKARKPGVHEYGLTQQLLAQLLATVQAAVGKEGEHVRVLQPATAWDVLDEETALADVAAINAGMVEVTDEQYAAFASGEWDGVSSWSPASS